MLLALAAGFMQMTKVWVGFPMAVVAAACIGPMERLRPACLHDVPVAVMICGDNKSTAFRVGPGVWVTSRHGMPDHPQSCFIDGVRRDVIAFTKGEGKGGDWSIVKLTDPELDPSTSVARFSASCEGLSETWAVGFTGSGQDDLACFASGRIALAVDAPHDLRTRTFVGLESHQDPIIPGMSGAPVMVIEESGTPLVVGVWCGWIEMRTTWAGLIRTTSVAGLVVVDPDLPIAVDRMLRQQP
jgi:hypothetical protein